MLLFANRRFFCFRKKYVIFLHLLVSWISHLKVMNKKHWNFAIASIEAIAKFRIKVSFLEG